MSKETEFNFSKIDNGGPMLSPVLSELRQDILAFNDGIESSNLSDEDLTEVCLEAQEEFDNRWPYMDKPMILSGYISPTYFNEGIDNLDFLHDEQIGSSPLRSFTSERRCLIQGLIFLMPLFFLPRGVRDYS